METLGYILTFFAGTTLGLLGGGGSVLTVPILVYCFSIQTILSTTYSLFIVGVSTLFGAISSYRQDKVQLSMVWLFFIPSSIGIYFGRSYLLEIIPDQLMIVGTKDNLVLMIFAILMIFSSYLMLFRKSKSIHVHSHQTFVFKFQFILRAFFVGLVTGLIGVGGGFLIVPALVFFAGLSIHKSIGTALLIVMINTSFAFLLDVGHVTLDWPFLLRLTLLSVSGIFAGQYLSRFISGSKLKPIFGIFILVLGCFILLKGLF